MWQCGGSIELVRCSRIAHVFGGMGVGCGWPGKPPGTKNKWRAIRAWMDDYADLMKDFLPEPKDLGDMKWVPATLDVTSLSTVTTDENGRGFFLFVGTTTI